MVMYDVSKTCVVTKLLADDGAIFISIDDNEQAFLKCVCDEILALEILWHNWCGKGHLRLKMTQSIFHQNMSMFWYIFAEIEKLKIKKHCLKVKNS